MTAFSKTQKTMKPWLWCLKHQIIYLWGGGSNSFLDIMTQLLKIIHRSCLEQFHGGHTSSLFHHCELEREHLLLDKKALRYFNTDVYIGPCDEDWPLENKHRCRSNEHIYQLQLEISVPSVGDSSDTAVIICHVNNIPARPIIHFKCIHFASGVRFVHSVVCKTAILAKCISCGAAFRWFSAGCHAASTHALFLWLVVSLSDCSRGSFVYICRHCLLKYNICSKAAD